MTLPWQERSSLAALAAAWQQCLAGRAVGAVAAGPGWLGLIMGGRSREFVTLVARPGLTLLWNAEEPPPGPVRAELGRLRRPPPAAHLCGCRLNRVGLLPADRVLALDFQRPDQPASVLLLVQLFGPRGNLALLDESGRCLWALFRPLHAVLTQRPPAVTFGGVPAAADEAARACALFREAALRHLNAGLRIRLQTQLERLCRQQRRMVQRLIENLGRDLAAARRGDEQRRLAETLGIHLTRVPRGATAVDLPDPAGGKDLHIALNPALSPSENMAHYFRLARKADRGRAIIAERLAAAQRHLADVQARERQLTAITGGDGEPLEALQTWKRENAGFLGAISGSDTGSGRARAGAEPGRPFRRYLIEGTWEVWAGRSNQENDTLTHQASAPGDIWLHAQGVPGSHVILRTGGKPATVPKRVLQKAASLAALHSKAKHSSLVPVVYTQRKYVRKPRRSPPGTATLIRSRTIFAVPGVPDQVEQV